MVDIPLTSPRIEKPLFSKLMQDAKVLSNISFILDKMDRDGHLHVLKSAITTVLKREINFAVGELSKIQKKSKNFDMKNQLTNNTFIFKENLKVISDFLGKLKS